MNQRTTFNQSLRGPLGTIQIFGYTLIRKLLQLKFRSNVFKNFRESLMITNVTTNSLNTQIYSRYLLRDP